jgi:hypothetical protein
VSPIGYIEVFGGASRFRPIFSPWSALPAVIFGAVLGAVISRLLRRQRG